jgi:hypothetical protein
MSGTSARKPLLATFFICALLGPPVGAAVMAFGSLAEHGIVITTLTALLLATGSYVSGGLSALASGIAMVGYGWLKGAPPLWFAVVCAVATFAVLQSGQNDQALNNALSLFAAHVVSSVVCWALFSRFWKTYELAAGTHPSPSLAGRGKTSP